MSAIEKRRNESQTMIQLLIEHDMGYCPGQSDIDGLYYFTLRSMESFEQILFDHEKFSEHVHMLYKILDALFPFARDLKKEWKKYQIMFREHFIHKKVEKYELDFIMDLFSK